jgi:hypothetical protein
MYNIRTLIISTVTAAVLFISCSKSVYDNAAKYLQKDFSKQYGNCNDSVSAHCASVKMTYPLFTFSPSSEIKDTLNKNVMNRLLSPIFEKKYSTINELADSLIADYKKVAKEFPDAPIGYTLERQINVLTNQKGLICLEYNEYSFLGGAHPNGAIFYDNYDLSNGKKVNLNDLLKIGYEAVLNNIAEKEFRKIRELKPDESLETAGFWFKDNKFILTNNFAVLKNGLKFYFNDYEIGSHVMGPTEIFILYSDIKQIIKEDGLITALIQN